MTTDSFVAALRHRSWIESHYRQRFQDLQAAFESAIATEFKQLFPKRKARVWRDALALFPDGGKPFRATWDERAGALGKEQLAAEDLADSALAAAAVDAPLPTGDRPAVLYREVSSGTYRSMGFGSCKYAMADAQRTVDKAHMHGLHGYAWNLETHYVPGFGCGTTEGTFGVFIDTTPLGWQVLKHKPDVSMVEYVRLCWKHGTNPRVMLPFLPHGFEEKNGLDFFGDYMK